MGSFLQMAGYAVMAISGLWASILSLGLVYDLFGLFWTVISIFILPIVFTVVPIYHGFTSGDWEITIIAYGGMGIAFILFMLGSSLDGE